MNEETAPKGTKESPIMVSDADVQTEKPGGLSYRDALEVAYEAHKDGGARGVTGKNAGDSSGDSVSNTSGHSTEKQQSNSIQSTGDTAASGAQAELQAPAGWDKEDKELFRQSSRAQQEAALKLDRKRNSTLENIKREKADLENSRKEYESDRELAKRMRPYLKARGFEEPDEVALKKVIDLYLEMNVPAAQAKKAAANYLKARGVSDIPESFLSEDNTSSIPDEKLTPLQQRLEQLENRIASEDLSKTQQTLQYAWNSFEQEKNAAGGSRFPDIATNSESGLRLASQIGTLVNGQTDLSKQFIANVQSRIPDLDHTKLFAEAYKYFGGKVDDTSTPAKSHNPQKQIQTYRRASASVPSGGVTSGNQPRKYGSYREALNAAYAHIKEQNNLG